MARIVPVFAVFLNLAMWPTTLNAQISHCGSAGCPGEYCGAAGCATLVRVGCQYHPYCGLGLGYSEWYCNFSFQFVTCYFDCCEIG